jgi:cytoskeletal protein CcmA (bactofilin family)
VEKKGALLGTSITCGNLTVHGTISGSIYASGTVHFKTSGRILGEIRCKKLLVDKKCDVHFLQPIHAENAEIYGDTHGSFFIAHKTILGKKGSIHGALETKLMHMEPGADVHGNLVINPHPEVDIFGPSSKELDALEAQIATEPGIGALFAQPQPIPDPLEETPAEDTEKSPPASDADEVITNEVETEKQSPPQPASLSLEDQIKAMFENEN